MIQYIDGELRITDPTNRFGDPSNVMVGELLESVLAAAELCLTTDLSYAPDAAHLIRLAALLVPSADQYQAMGDAIAGEDIAETLEEPAESDTAT